MVARALDGLISAEAGMRRAMVSFKTGTVRILCDSQTVTTGRLMMAMIRHAEYATADGP